MIYYSQLTETRVRKFVTLYGKEIIAAIRGTGLFFSTVVAQKSMESQSKDGGLSKLATVHNNFGGIKNFGSLPGAGVIMVDTVEIVHGKKVAKKQPFATFPNPTAGFKAYVKALQDPNKKYRSMGVFDAPTPEEQILRIAKAGYTTQDPQKYLELVKGRIYACKDIYNLGRIN